MTSVRVRITAGGGVVFLVFAFMIVKRIETCLLQKIHINCNQGLKKCTFPGSLSKFHVGHELKTIAPL